VPNTLTQSRHYFAKVVRASVDEVVDLCVRLTQTNSENPPGDTEPIAALVESYLSSVGGIELSRISPRPPIVNLIARVKGRAPGRRLIMNGHLDTFPIGDAESWSVSPLGGQIRNNRIYGRGVADMKAGVAAGLVTLALFARYRTSFDGELVLTLVGDEETGGLWGTKYVLDNVPEAAGDAMICGDAGSPRVVRFGEKGQIWFEVTAHGKSAHGAHVHLGDNAIERLMLALSSLKNLERKHEEIPEAIHKAILSAQPISETESGAGEANTLQRVTVNVGLIHGGTAVNVVPDSASAKIDVRFPPGLKVSELEDVATALLAEIESVDIRTINSSEANVTDPREEIVALTVKNAREYLGGDVVANMRVGFSDARFYRYRSIPSVVYGPTPYGMGAADEYVTIEDLKAVFFVHAMTAYDFLSDQRKQKLRVPR
jgi:succinyl-diaminopimelate desuccinylase